MEPRGHCDSQGPPWSWGVLGAPGSGAAAPQDTLGKQAAGEAQGEKEAQGPACSSGAVTAWPRGPGGDKGCSGESAVLISSCSRAAQPAPQLQPALPNAQHQQGHCPALHPHQEAKAASVASRAPDTEPAATGTSSCCSQCQAGHTDAPPAQEEPHSAAPEAAQHSAPAALFSSLFPATKSLWAAFLGLPDRICSPEEENLLSRRSRLCEIP